MISGKSVAVRVRAPGTGNAVTVDDQAPLTGVKAWPAKEFSIDDDVLSVADTASVSVDNDDGRTAGAFSLGQRVEFDMRDPDVAGGQWVRQFTGRITNLESYSDSTGGSNILITAKDLGWHLTSCMPVPHKNIRKVTFLQLLQLLIDPSWGILISASSIPDNVKNTRLKQGRAGVAQAVAPQFGAVLPLIQTEIGQSPWDIIGEYIKRLGLLLNVGLNGELILFRPQYTEPALYAAQFHGDTRQHRNNVIGRPTLRQAIDGLYSEVQCWSTKIIPDQQSGTAATDNPNANYTSSVYTPTQNPLPFVRRMTFSDSEAITKKMRQQRAIWRQQMDEFSSWTYECEFPGVSQNGFFFTSDSMLSVNDTINAVDGSLYVSSVRKSMTIQGGTRTKVTLRRPVLDPSLTAQAGGGVATKGPPGQVS